ncbi:major facilitator superfamily domain-containing protein [Emericellopsis atlantica]|uniref:Lysosomal dipeptide transporter MFSD1 n=1 Tax=Emericellopsis atlantica TaxID=2614577 RepID=A0A9P8CRE0_9HYPO|nr:major facilitator superfamily domain-containing protein [Emericellopsis atlantica]KAG9256919.1 major facilitator superfamily domain-containing protein [Emericellopsis atlantica]
MAQDPVFVPADAEANKETHVEAGHKNTAVAEVDSSQSDTSSQRATQPVPLSWKLASVVLVTCIGFGSKWSSGVTGAMKSTMKKELNINNTQFSILEASEDFMVTALMMLSGVVTDRIGGAGAMLYGNAIYSVGSILVAAAAQTRSYKFMIGGRVISALGDIATQVAQYKVFSSWFAPNNGFASTLGFELGIGKIGAFAGKASANIIAERTGDFAWVFWVAVFMNIFTNVMTGVFYWFTRLANRKYHGIDDPATGEKLQEKSKKLHFKKVLQLPWSFWTVMAFSLFQTSTAVVFLQNATELAEQRFKTSSITAGWYSAVLQYAGFFVVPLLGVFLDLFGQRISALFFCGVGVFASMLLVCFSDNVKGTAASFGIFAFSYCFGPTTIIDSTRTSMWDSTVFGSAYAVKITMNNAMNIIVRVVTGRIQDADNNSYDKVTIVYVILAGCSVVVSLGLTLISWKSIDLRHLQWSRSKRIARGAELNERRELFFGVNKAKNMRTSLICFGVLIALVLGSWCAYFWGVATGNNG